MNFLSELLIFYSLSIGVWSFRGSHDSTCKTNDETCVDIYECRFFDELLLKTGLPRPHHVIKEIRKRQCGFIGKNPAVCCPKTEEIVHRDVREEDTINLEQHRNLNLLPVDKCGAFSLDSRITHGSEAVLGEFPWMALIVYETSNSGPDFLCAGSLISERYILTAAHCILKTIIGVRLGEYNILTSQDCDENNFYCAPAVQDFYIESAEIHSKYNRATDHNDIALIRLAQVADLTQVNVYPICLPIWGIPIDEGKQLTVAGWGMTETGHKNAILKKASLPTVSLEKCQKIFDGQANITAFQMCAGGKGPDSCNGDSGGPLTAIIPVKEVPRHVQFGIVSYGPKRCGTYGMPGIYTRIDPYLEWILNTIRP